MENSSNGQQLTELMAGKAGEHLVCFDLLTQGVEAFLSAQALPFDVVAVVNGKVYRIQVKSAIKLRKDKYIFSIKYGKSGNYKPYTINEVDIVAFVSLETKEIAYLPTGDCKSIIEFMVSSNKGSYTSEVASEKIRQAVAFRQANPRVPLRQISEQFEMSFNTLKKQYRNSCYDGRWSLRYFGDYPFSKAIE